MKKIRELPPSGYDGIKKMYQRSFLPLLCLAGPDSLQSWGNDFFYFLFIARVGACQNGENCRKTRVKTGV
ncbi:hypothetical protein NC653_028999 [Populus alba x Populus x berolinensis]|uniref:Uncharacterized protein n=1 Tax=Populus alba x Populus x berolinensis TaxID=444605 RepID=A0AAD6M136_9ROSI|nr:hypothetical protein NC653_028999 [Populus alba x Populus x berolinensis]